MDLISIFLQVVDDCRLIQCAYCAPVRHRPCLAILEIVDGVDAFTHGFREIYTLPHHGAGITLTTMSYASTS